MIKVYVRNQSGENQQLLGEFYPDEISQLPNLFKTFLTRADTTGGTGVCVQAEFVIGDEATYFEIVIDTERHLMQDRER